MVIVFSVIILSHCKDSLQSMWHMFCIQWKYLSDSDGPWSGLHSTLQNCEFVKFRKSPYEKFGIFSENIRYFGKFGNNFGKNWKLFLFFLNCSQKFWALLGYMTPNILLDFLTTFLFLGLWFFISQPHPLCDLCTAKLFGQYFDLINWIWDICLTLASTLAHCDICFTLSDVSLW